MIDAVVEDGNTLTDANLGCHFLERIVKAIDMTMILPPVTVKFPHATSELNRVLEHLKDEGLHESQTASKIQKDLQLREDELYGFSTFVLIAESHISIHTFPEFGYFSFDCYSCKSFDVEVVVEAVKDYFDINKMEVQVSPRRIPISLHQR